MASDSHFVANLGESDDDDDAVEFGVSTIMAVGILGFEVRPGRRAALYVQGRFLFTQREQAGFSRPHPTLLSTQASQLSRSRGGLVAVLGAILRFQWAAVRLFSFEMVFELVS